MRGCLCLMGVCVFVVFVFGVCVCMVGVCVWCVWGGCGCLCLCGGCVWGGCVCGLRAFVVCAVCMVNVGWV